MQSDLMQNAGIEKNADETFFTIVIPTRERCDTLLYAIQSALSVDYTNYEVLVSDNASTDLTRQVVSSFNHPKIRYVNTGMRVSMSENWEFALNHIDNGWVTVIGDDDAMLPGSLKIVNNIIKSTGLKAIRSNGASYIWPSLLAKPYGKLSVSLANGYEIRSSLKCLKKVLDGLLSYNELPMLYNGGFVSKCLIDMAREVNGKMFMSMTPDVYSAIVFSLLTDNYVYCNEPLAINGASQHSGGTAAFQRVKISRSYNPSEKFNSENNLPIHNDVDCLNTGLLPRSIPVIVYECFLQSYMFCDHRRNIYTTRAKQLQIALSFPTPDYEEIFTWGKHFASKHNLRIPNKAEIFLNILLFQFRAKYNLIRGTLNSISVSGNSMLPLSNVFQAAIAAGLITTLRPSRLMNLRKKFTLFLAKKLK